MSIWAYECMGVCMYGCVCRCVYVRGGCEVGVGVVGVVPCPP